ncbi:MAG: site-specific DNA-methyltransferase [Bryobacteraceae bacterium]
MAAPNRLALSDNLPFMRTLPDATIDLIYADPPFFTRRQHNAFSDVWPGGIAAYIAWFDVRLREMHRLLKPTGSLIVHCDWHASHYIKVALDGIFGYQRFVNEIVWCYKSGGASPKRRFSRKHDALLWYAKGRDYYFAAPREKSYNRGRKPYRFAGVAEYEDENGWYTVVGMKDWWEIDMVGRTSRERAGYPTQKPLRLLERVVEACCPADGVVADFFCGSGTTAVAATRLHRGWIACDESPEAVRLTRERLEREAS